MWPFYSVPTHVAPNTHCLPAASSSRSELERLSFNVNFGWTQLCAASSSRDAFALFPPFLCSAFSLKPGLSLVTDLSGGGPLCHSPLGLFWMSSVAQCHQMSLSSCVAVFPSPLARPCLLFINTFLFPHVFIKPEVKNKETTTMKTFPRHVRVISRFFAVQTSVRLVFISKVLLLLVNSVFRFKNYRRTALLKVARGFLSSNAVTVSC